MENNLKISLPHLLKANDLTLQDIHKIFIKTSYFLEYFKPETKFDDLKGVTVALAFFEPSTRTKLSFELAAKRLSADLLSFQAKQSSLVKGESILDTLKTIEVMGIDVFVIRHGSSGVPVFLQKYTDGIIVNAGDGRHEHPTQALLDSFTLYQKFGKIEGLKICIVGDILHSRVARSNIFVLKTLGAEVSACGPGTLLPNSLKDWGVNIIDTIEDAIEWSDVLLVLRLQKERMESGLLPSIREFTNYYGVTKERVSHKKELVILHPGPVNYGIELDYNLSNHENVLIQTQVKNGVFVRMALLSLLVKSKKI